MKMGRLWQVDERIFAAECTCGKCVIHSCVVAERMKLGFLVAHLRGWYILKGKAIRFRTLRNCLFTLDIPPSGGADIGNIRRLVSRVFLESLPQHRCLQDTGAAGNNFIFTAGSTLCSFTTNLRPPVS